VELVKKATAVRQAAQALAAAIEAKNLDEVKKQVAFLSNLKKLPPEGDAGADADLAATVPIKVLMKQVQENNKKLVEYKRLSSAKFAERGKAEEITSTAHRMAALSVAITAHAPEKDLPKDKTKKDWLAATEGVRKATLELAAAAKAKNQSGVKAAIGRMDNACTKCHDDFRVETIN